MFLNSGCWSTILGEPCAGSCQAELQHVLLDLELSNEHLVISQRVQDYLLLGDRRWSGEAVDSEEPELPWLTDLLVQLLGMGLGASQAQQGRGANFVLQESFATSGCIAW